MNHHNIKNKIVYLLSSGLSFFEAEHLNTQEIVVPLSAQMLRQHTRANASGNITTPIGARLETSLPRGNFSLFTATCSNTEQLSTEDTAPPKLRNQSQHNVSPDNLASNFTTTRLFSLCILLMI